MTKATFYNIWSENLGRGSPLSARASNQDISKKSYYPFIGQYASRYIHYIVTNGWYTSPPPSAMVVAHFTPTLGSWGYTPPHPRGVTLHLAPETTMTIHSWQTDDFPPGSQMLIHTMLPTQMLLSHTTLPTWMLLSHTMLPTRMLLSHTTLPTRMLLSHTTLPTRMLLSHTTLPTRMLLSHTTLPTGSRCHSLVTTAYRTWGFSNTLLTAPWVGLTNIPCMPPPLGLTLPHCHLPLGGHHKYTMVCHLPLGTWHSVA